jgi:hypothetical protein
MQTDIDIDTNMDMDIGVKSVYVPYGTRPVPTRNLEPAQPQPRDGLQPRLPSATPFPISRSLMQLQESL